MAILLVLAFPLITGLGYSCAFMIVNVRARGAQPRRFERIAPLLYPLFLLIPLIGVLIAGPSSLSWAGMGLRAPRIGTLSPVPALLAAIAIGAVTGLALFLGERTVHRRAARRGELPANRQQPEGNGLLPLFLLASVAVALSEELVWRGYLIPAMSERWDWALWMSLLVSAAAFGSNHYFFGLRDVLLKSFGGLVWGALFLGTGSLLAPLVSHLVFDLLVWTPLNEL